MKKTMACAAVLMVSAVLSAGSRPEVAAYYFGSWHADPRNDARLGKGWTEWIMLKGAKPRFEGHKQPKVPLWGYLDESKSEVMEKKIDAAADHGVDAFIFDWYYYDDGPFLNRSIDEGFLRARNRNRIKFALMWANHDWMHLYPAPHDKPQELIYPGKVSPATFDRICDHVIEDYFRQPNYWKVGGKPYFSVFNVSKFAENFGSFKATQDAVARFKEKAKAAGLGGVHMNAVYMGRPQIPGEGVPEDAAELIRALGFDSATSYVWYNHVRLPKRETDYNWVRGEYLKFWDGMVRDFKMPYFPNLTVGWDCTPRTEQDAPWGDFGYPYTNVMVDNTPANFRKSCESVRSRLEAHPELPQIVVVNSWNEWTEGSYLEPDVEYGYGYLEALRDVFGTAPKPGDVSVEVRGDLRDRIERNFNRLEEEKYRPDRVFLTDEQSGGWPGDTEGRTILGLVLDAKATGREPKYLGEILKRLPSKLNAKGYMGDILPAGKVDEQQLSGNGWMLRGLCERYLWKREPQVKEQIRALARGLFLPAKGRFAQYPIDPARRQKDVGAPAGSRLGEVDGWIVSSDVGCFAIGLDGLVQAWEVTGDDELRPVIDEMVARFLEIDLVAIRAQTHATLTGLRALLRYAGRCDAVRAAELLGEVETRFALYRACGMTETFENVNWFKRYDTWTEPCAIVDSYMVAVRLWRLTHKDEYLELADEIWWNGLLPTQRANGGFGTHNIPGKASGTAELKDLCPESHWCCTMRGAEGLAAGAASAAFADGDTLTLAQYRPAKITAELASGRFVCEEMSDYPEGGRVVVRVLEAPASEVTVRFFRPSYLIPLSPSEVRRVFKPGELVVFQFRAPLRTVEPVCPENALPGVRKQMRGPRVVDGKSDGRERRVGIFYFLWHCDDGHHPPRDISKMLAADPGLARRPDDPAWGGIGFMHHWGEPLYGYYSSDDEWVVRRHMKLLMQSGVDFIYFDVTNTLIYEDEAKLVMRVLQEYHDAGWKIPKVMFYTNTESGPTVQKLYDAIYRPGFAKDTWFKLDGKPVVVAHENECSAEAKATFTIVKSQWPNEADKPGGWPWMDFTRPQRVFPGEKVAKSVLNVSVAQHPQLRFGDSVLYGEKGNCGRAYHDGANDPAPGAWTLGGNFREQCLRALEADSDIVLVTGWNEWTAGRWQGGPDRPMMFVDCCNYEYSRDIEMMRGGYGDRYFLQLCDFVRRYKRVDDEVLPNRPGVARRYRCFADSGMPRDWPGYGQTYVNRTQRNVPRWIDVSHDRTSVRFTVRTRAPIAGAGVGDFMRIYVDGRCANDFGETTVAGDTMTLVVPRAEFGLAPGDFTFGFKFVDSAEKCADALDWYDHGVVEPLGRNVFLYRGSDARGFTHAMPRETNETPTQPSYGEMAKTFADPFGKVRTGAYWYWLSGRVSCEGIRRDLAAMKAAGIDRAYIGDVGEGGNAPGPVRTFTDGWWKALGTAFEAAAEFGIELGIFNSPGWSQSGGPWITHDRAMRRLAASSATAAAGEARPIVLAKPVSAGAKADEYEDVAVVAYPEIGGVGEISNVARSSSRARRLRRCACSPRGSSSATGGSRRTSRSRRSWTARSRRWARGISAASTTDSTSGSIRRRRRSSPSRP